MENPVTKVIHIQEFDFEQWFEYLKRFEKDYYFREQEGWHAVELERDFYYVLENVKDLALVEKILKYICSNSRDLRFNIFGKLIQKNKHLFLEYYRNVMADQPENVEMQMALQSHDADRQAFCTELQNCVDPHFIQQNILKNEMSAWLLTVFRTDYHADVDIKTNIIEGIISKIYSSADDYMVQIQKLENLGADIAFYTRTLTPKMSAIFMAPLKTRFYHNGWHEIYCEKMFTRLILPILNVIEQEPNINKDAFVNLMLYFLEHYRKETVLKLFPNQLITVFKLLARDDDTFRLRTFLAYV